MKHQETQCAYSEVSLALGVFDVQPEHIEGEVQCLEGRVHCLYVSLVSVVPATLVVAQGEGRGQGLGPGQCSVLGYHLLGARSGEQKHIDESGLEQPVALLEHLALSPAPAIGNIHKTLRGIEPKHALDTQN